MPLRLESGDIFISNGGGESMRRINLLERSYDARREYIRYLMIFLMGSR